LHYFGAIARGSYANPDAGSKIALLVRWVALNLMGETALFALFWCTPIKFHLP